jgi:hypothetical protein
MSNVFLEGVMFFEKGKKKNMATGRSDDKPMCAFYTHKDKSHVDMSLNRYLVKKTLNVEYWKVGMTQDKKIIVAESNLYDTCSTKIRNFNKFNKWGEPLTREIRMFSIPSKQILENKNFYKFNEYFEVEFFESPIIHFIIKPKKQQEEF